MLARYMWHTHSGGLRLICPNTIVSACSRLVFSSEYHSLSVLVAEFCAVCDWAAVQEIIGIHYIWQSDVRWEQDWRR